MVGAAGSGRPARRGAGRGARRPHLARARWMVVAVCYSHACGGGPSGMRNHLDPVLAKPAEAVRFGRAQNSFEEPKGSCTFSAAVRAVGAFVRQRWLASGRRERDQTEVPPRNQPLLPSLAAGRTAGAGVAGLNGNPQVKHGAGAGRAYRVRPRLARNCAKVHENNN